MPFDLKPMTTAIGAEVYGLDLRRKLAEDDVKALRSALDSHLVLFFRDQPLSPDEQLQLAQSFGPIDSHPFGSHVDSHPNVGILDQDEPKRDGANRWHTDSTFMPTPPAVMTLRAIQLPSKGGDTTWASMPAAYDALSAPIQQMLETLTASHDVTGPLLRAIQGGHSMNGIEEIQRDWPVRSHPVVCGHPRTNRKVLYVNPNFTTRIDGLSESESDALLRFLFEWIRTPDFHVRFKWEPDSLVVWDNHATQHFAVADYSERRIMQRVQVAGEWRPSA